MVIEESRRKVWSRKVGRQEGGGAKGNPSTSSLKCSCSHSVDRNTTLPLPHPSSTQSQHSWVSHEHSMQQHAIIFTGGKTMPQCNKLTLQHSNCVSTSEFNNARNLVGIRQRNHHLRCIGCKEGDSSAKIGRT